METKVLEIHSKYAEQVNTAKQENYKADLINSLTDAEKEGVKLLSQLGDSLGGPQVVNKLVRVYNLIVGNYKP